MQITYLVHGTSTDNEAGIRSGWSDPELSTTGREQAKSLADMLQNHRFDAVFVSDLTRALQTASAAFSERAVIIEPRLREMNYGEHN
jgi:broad specificity phosphatase PhoE